MEVKDTSFCRKKSINCNGKIIDLSKPVIMGILNVTPDSFYDGGKWKTEKDLLHHTNQMLQEGATFIDIGGQSTRPGAEEIKVEEELKKVIPAIKMVKKEFPESIISIDTFNAAVAQEAVNFGASMINDISGGSSDKEMFETVAKLKVPYIIMHIQGKPQSMQGNPTYENVVKEIILYFSEKLSILKQLGIKDIIIDPGFGFGKTLEHNYKLLGNLSSFKIFELPIMVGISRKSMICKALNVSPDNALSGTIAAHMAALMNNANILRVHDVKEAVETVKIFNSLNVGQINFEPLN